MSIDGEYFTIDKPDATVSTPIKRFMRYSMRFSGENRSGLWIELDEVNMSYDQRTLTFEFSPDFKEVNVRQGIGFAPNNVIIYKLHKLSDNPAALDKFRVKVAKYNAEARAIALKTFAEDTVSNEEWNRQLTPDIRAKLAARRITMQNEAELHRARAKYYGASDEELQDAVRALKASTDYERIKSGIAKSLQDL